MRIKMLVQTIFSFLGEIFQSITPTKKCLKWSSYLIYIITALLLIITAGTYFKPLGFISTGLLVIVPLILAFLSGLLLNLVLLLLTKIPEFFRTSIAALLTVSIFLLYFNSTVLIITYIYVILSTSILGITLYNIIRGRVREFSIIGKTATYIFLIISSVALMIWAYWLISPGRVIEYPTIAALESEYRPQQLTVPNPSEKGNNSVARLTYGSGKDRHRPEFGKDTDMITEPVDGSKFLSQWKGLSGKLRARYFGFDKSSLPLNGTVWYPEEEGVYPLILIVHGNHLAQEYSDPGYAYLGELWASQGMITVSVDQNFLNGTFTDIIGGLKDENDARAWLLLEHLHLWKQWNEDVDNPFYGRVNMDKIALAGHSRGGEAVAHAALFNTLPYYPDDGSVVFDYNFNIVSLIAIAPCDGQYLPSIVRTPLRDINYLTIHGSHDADVTSFSGQRQFERISFSRDFKGFAATVYVYGANHGQFNTVWGNKDSSSPHINHYNLKQLIAGEKQRKIGKVFMTAFLMRTLFSVEEYEQLFIDYRSAPEDWLPETVYLQQYRNKNFYPVCTFDEDLNLTTTTIPKGTITGTNLTDWYERRIRLKHYSMDSKAVYLGWNAEEDTLIASYRIDLPPDYITADVFYLYAADTGKTPSSKEKETVDNEADSLHAEEEDVEINDITTGYFQSPKLIDFSIMLSDDKGVAVSFKLSDYLPMQPHLEAKLGKLGIIHPKPYGESIQQLFMFDLSELILLVPEFNLQKISTIELIFNETPKGVVLVSEIGFVRH